MKERILVLAVQPVFGKGKKIKEGKSVAVNQLHDAIPEAEYKEKHGCQQIHITALTGMFGEGQPHCRSLKCLEFRLKTKFKKS